MNPYLILILVPLALVGIFLSSSQNHQTLPPIQTVQPITANQGSAGNSQYNSLLVTTTIYMRNLPTLDPSSVQSFQSYKDFVDKLNDGIKILNDKLGFQISTLQGTQDEYDKISKVVTEYTPMISSYNNMIYAARDFNPSDTNSVQNFYVNTGTFSLEFALIYSAVYAGPAYDLVGVAYRSSGLQTLAFDCGSCISTVLSNAHWFIRSSFVEGTAVAISTILDGVGKLIPQSISTP